ncbi:TPA: hypothetical protein NJ542_004370 [Vibrio parahaemolyticus]|nr:hypothetical protein [Vibrio parahaemolyticus]
MGKNNSGGQLARNFRPGQIAEGLALQLCRPFMAMAHIEQEEDFGIDFIGTLLKQASYTYTAESSCMIQAKISTSARFTIKGLGVTWLKQLVLPYFPLVVDRSKSTAHLYTLNDWHKVIHLSLVDEYIFVLDDDLANDPFDSFFTLGDPIMSWNIEESTHVDFCKWAYSIMNPVIAIETRNQRFASIGRFEKIENRNFRFCDRSNDGSAINPPQEGIIEYQYAGNHDLIKSEVSKLLLPLVASITNMPFCFSKVDSKVSDLNKLLYILDTFGVEGELPITIKKFIDELASETNI